MALRKNVVVDDVPTVKFYIGGVQVFEKQTSRTFYEGDVVGLWGRQYRVDVVSAVFDVVQERESTDVHLGVVA